MNKFKFFLRQHKAFATLLLTIGLILCLGVVISASVLFKSYANEKFFDQQLCLTNACVKAFLTATDQAFAIAKSTFDFAVAIATIGGIFVALQSYSDTSSNAALANHIEHLKVFGEYLEIEVKKRDRLSSTQIDTLLLYGKIFTQSRSGKTTVSEDYQNFIKILNTIILESNERCVIGTPGGFSYLDHQRKIRDHLAHGGIKVVISPRNDYFEMETQLFSLLHRVGQSFCQPSSLPEILKPSYY